MLGVVFSGLWARKRRLLGTATAVVLGVAFLAATLVLGDTMRSDFRQAFTDANSGTDVIVRSASNIGGEESVRGLVDAGLVDEVAAIDGVDRAVPVVEGIATIIGSDGDRIGGDGPPTTAANWIDDPELNSYRLAEGRAPAADDEGGPGGAKPYEVVIDRRSADIGNLAVGDRTTVLTPAPVEVTVVGIATFGDDDSLGPITYTAFTLPAAQELLTGRPDAISGVLVAAENGVSQETLRDEIMELMPARIEALTQPELTAEQEEEIESDFLGMLEIILIAFAGVAMVVAAFSIHNTLSIVVAQRTRESALLRSIGASRRQVVAGVAIESLVIGVLASAVGLAVGIGLATGLKTMLAGADLALSSGGLVISTAAIVVAATVGIVTTLVASVAPAIKASRVAPLAALRDVEVDRSAASKLRAAVGVLVAGAGLAAVTTGASSGDGAVGRVGVGAIAVLVGAVVLGPVVARPAAATLGSGAAITRGVTGRLARRNAMRNPRRIAASASALMVGTGVVALFTTFGASLKATIDDTVDTKFGGDLIVLQDGFGGAALSPELAGAIAERPEVADAVGTANAIASIEGDDVAPVATDFARLDAILDMGVTEGALGDLGAGKIAVSQHYAEEHRVAVGDTIPMSFVDGATTDLEVGVVYTERMSFGDLVMSDTDWAPHARQTGDVVVMVDLADGVSEAEGHAAVSAVTERYAAPDPQTRDEYKGSIGSEIDQMLAMIYGLLAIAVLIAVMGIGNTLALSVHERTRELGLLRAVGQTRRQLRSTVRWESVIMAVFGTVGGLAVGTFLGWALMRAINAEEGFGVFEAPVSSLAVVLVLAAVAGVIAAVRPARRASPARHPLRHRGRLSRLESVMAVVNPLAPWWRPGKLFRAGARIALGLPMGIITFTVIVTLGFLSIGLMPAFLTRHPRRLDHVDGGAGPRACGAVTGQRLRCRTDPRPGPAPGPAVLVRPARRAAALQTTLARDRLPRRPPARRRHRLRAGGRRMGRLACPRHDARVRGPASRQRREVLFLRSRDERCVARNARRRARAAVPRPVDHARHRRGPTVDGARPARADPRGRARRPGDARRDQPHRCGRLRRDRASAHRA